MKKVEITLPKLGESVAEATLTAWKVNVGDEISRDEILCEIGTDKVESELPSEYSGTIHQLLFQEGDTIQVGEAIAIISTNEKVHSTSQTVDDDHTAHQQAEQPEKPELIEQSQNEKTGFLSPVVRKMIAKNNISQQEILQLKGSGQNNRITKKDIEAFLNKQNQSLQQPHKKQLPVTESDEVRKLSRTRLVLAERLTESVQWIPHVTTFKEVDVAQMIGQRKELQRNHEQKISLTHCMMYCVIKCLKEYPQLNSWMNVDEWIVKKEINLGFAVALSDEQLLVPNLKQAGRYEIPELVKNINLLVEKANTKQLNADDLQYATFTISNTGIYGSEMGTPIITAPQVAILAFGAIQRKPVVKTNNSEEVIAVSSVMNCSLSYDHRIIDGKLASEFLSRLKMEMEQFKA